MGVVGGCAGGGCVVHACQSTSLLVTGRRCSLGAAGPGHPPSRSRGCSSEGSCCTQQFGISCKCGRKQQKRKLVSFIVYLYVYDASIWAGFSYAIMESSSRVVFRHEFWGLVRCDSCVVKVCREVEAV